MIEAISQRFCMSVFEQQADFDREQTGFLHQLGPAILKMTIQVNKRILESWQSIVNTLAEFCDVPTVLIRRLDGRHMKVLSANESPDNPYPLGHSQDRVR